jgi:ribosomal protein L21E
MGGPAPTDGNFDMDDICILIEHLKEFLLRLQVLVDNKRRAHINISAHNASYTHVGAATSLSPLNSQAIQRAEAVVQAEGMADGVTHTAAYTHSGAASPLSPSKDKAIQRAEARERAQAWATCKLRSPMNAHVCRNDVPLGTVTKTTNCNAEGCVDCVTCTIAYTHNAAVSPLSPLKVQAIRRAESFERVQARAAQEVRMPKMAHVNRKNVPKNAMTKTTNDKAEERAAGVIVPGDRVMITWDRYWKWNTTKTHMPKTHYEGSTGTVVRMTECFVWVRLDDNEEVMKKRKHNVMLVSSKK